METRPFASILFVNVETKRSIPASKPHLTRELRRQHLPFRDAVRSTSGRGPDPVRETAGLGRGGRSGPRALNEAGATATVPCPVRTGNYGITWNLMGVNGRLMDCVEIRGMRLDCGSFATIARGSLWMNRREVVSARGRAGIAA